MNMTEQQLERLVHKAGACATRALAYAAGLLVALPLCADVLLEHSGRDAFLKGTLGNGGQNLFVTADGKLKTINWFDFNRDGYPEVLAVNDQNPYENVDVMIYPNSPRQGLRSLLPPLAQDMAEFQALRWAQERMQEMTFLPTLGAGRSAVADLNDDGYPDLIIPNFIHGWAKDHFPVFVYWGGPDGFSLRNRSEFPSLAAKSVAVADLDGNGFADLILANYGMEYHASDTFFGDQYTSWVYLQNERGFDEGRRLELPTAYAIDVATGYIGEDTRPSVVFLNAGKAPFIRIFRGGDSGIDAAQFEDIPVNGAAFRGGITNRLLFTDLNGDGLADIFVSSRDKMSEIFWQGAEGFTAENRTQLPVDYAVGAAAADLNDDGYIDLVVTSHAHETPDKKRDFETDSLIFWGSKGGFSADNVTPLPTIGAAAVAIGDLDGDGRLDLLFANSRTEQSYDIPSYIYWGGKDGYAPERRSDLTAFGPVDVLLEDFSGNGRLDVFMVNRQSGGTLSESVPSYVYWGNAAASYSPADMTSLPLHRSGYSASVADLSGNGRADIVFSVGDGITVAYADDNGAYLPENFQTHEMPFRGFTTTLADLNRDGWLDLIVGGLNSVENKPLAILWGGPQGLSEAEYFELDGGILSTAVGDVRGDGTLALALGGRKDIIVAQIGADGRPDLAGALRMEVPRQTQRLTFADVNNNGSLDLVAAHYRDFNTKTLETYSSVYWNEGGAYRFDNRQDFPTLGSHWVSLSDLRNTGELDLIFSNYHGERNRVVDLYIYTADENGALDPERKLRVPAASSSSHYAANLTGGEWKDLVVFNHTGPNQYLGLHPKSGVHGYGSWLYSGQEEGYSRDRRSTLPTFGPHRTINAEWGDIARRASYETYTSAPEQVRVAAGAVEVQVSGDFHAGSALGVEIKAGADGQWLPLERVRGDAAVQVFSGEVKQAASLLQYRLKLDHGRSGTAPIVTAVSIGQP